MSRRQVRQILSDMPYVDEEFYHSFRWHKPIPAPRPYGDMIITATSRRANHNEQPRRRDATPRRSHSHRRSPSRPRQRSPSPRPATWTRKAPPPAAPVAEPYDPGLDPWATPIPDPEPTPAQMPTRPAPPELPTVITPSITPRRNKIPAPDPLEMAKETLSHYVPTTVEPVPRPVPPPARPINTDISQAVAPPMDPMAQSWQVVSGFPTTPGPAPPRIPDALANLWLQRPPDNFTALLPPTHPAGQHGLLRSDSPFRLYSQLLHEFTDWIRTSRPDLPLHLGPWGSILQAPMRRDPVTNASYYDRIQMIPMASETATADEPIMKFWWHQWLLRTRADAQQRFATQEPSRKPAVTSSRTPSNLPTFCPSQPQNDLGMTGAPKAKARANTSPTANHSDPSEPHDGLTTNRTSNRHLVSRSIPTGNNRHHGRHLHSNSSQWQPNTPPPPTWAPNPRPPNQHPKGHQPKGKGGRRANPPPAGNRDNTERRQQRLRRPRCPASNSCFSPSHQTNPSSTSASLTVYAQHHKPSNS